MKIEAIIVRDIAQAATYTYKADPPPGTHENSNFFRDCKNTREAFKKTSEFLTTTYTPVVLTLKLESHTEMTFASIENDSDVYFMGLH